MLVRACADGHEWLVAPPEPPAPGVMDAAWRLVQRLDDRPDLTAALRRALEAAENGGVAR